ncbi:unnamed protein product [Porites evermanni]|uniref:Uncharacterized protein n=1 Tax=Porites evermanni TaxID=104178 RepID=A0ABN8RPM9_9CNID|nr:unnamed protein product [Porites evermanni]CAH3179303.1 unnamed protein product [Porites evermanni]
MVLGDDHEFSLAVDGIEINRWDDIDLLGVNNSKYTFDKHVTNLCSKVYQAQCERLKENPLLPNTSVIFKSDPYFDKRDRLLQVRGRLQYLDLPEGMKHPIILPYGASSG